MARRGSTRKGVMQAAKSGAAPAKSAPRSTRLPSLVSSLASRVVSAARSAVSRRRGRAAGKPTVKRAALLRQGFAAAAAPKREARRGAAVSASKPAATSAKPAAPPPITRRSVVNKPPRRPTVRAGRSAATPAGRTGVIGRVAEILAGHGSKRAAAPDQAGAAPRSPGQGPIPSISQPSLRGPVHLPSPEEQFSIPNGYGDTRIVLMVKDPWWLYAYWEVQPEVERAARGQLLPHEVAGLQSVLRVYDVTGIAYPARRAHHSFDISLSGLATNWYIHTNAPGRSFIVEVGLLTGTGRFLLLARSNCVAAPRFGPSDVLDEEWMCSDDDYWKLFGVAAGFGMGASPSGLRPFLERRMFSPGLFSPGMFSPGLFSPVKIRKERGFWCWVEAELIVYGGTDPKASVTLQGHPITLKQDGTFSVRMALPDGIQTIPVSATSPDRVETRTITPIVTRKTEFQTSDIRPQPAVQQPSAV